MADLLGLPHSTQQALYHVYEPWSGGWVPHGSKADDIAIACRVDVGADRLPELAAAFGDLADVKVPHLQGHSRQVARLAAGAARRLGLATAEVRQVEIAGSLHDVGRVGSPTRCGRSRMPRRLGAYRSPAEAAERWKVDRSTVVHNCRAAKQEALVPGRAA